MCLNGRGGKLVSVETTRMRILLGLLYGTLTGYWQQDDRTEGPFMNLETWERRFAGHGLFQGVDMHVDDYEAPHNTNIGPADNASREDQ